MIQRQRRISVIPHLAKQLADIAERLRVKNSKKALV